MQKLFAFFVVLALAAAAAAPSIVRSRTQVKDAAPKLRRKAAAVPGSYIVVLDDGQVGRPGALSAAPYVAEGVAAAYGARVGRVYQHALNGFSARMTEEQALRLSEDPRVAFVEEDGVVTATTVQTPATWGLDRIDQRDRPLDGQYTYTPNGKGVNVYVIDTGIRVTHTQFGGRASVGVDVLRDGQNGLDCNGHGTHVAGTVGGSTYGVAKAVKLIAVRVLDCAGNGTDSTALAGVDWVTAHAVGPAVANMSLGGGASSALDAAVNNSIDSGITYAVAAGNDYGVDACTESPGRVDAALTVGSTTSTDAKSDFSNIGRCVDIFAPGSSIQSAWYTSNTATNTISGTSMATPHVAGAAALYLQNNPNATPATVAEQILGCATRGRLTGIGTGSPNALLWTPGL